MLKRASQIRCRDIHNLEVNENTGIPVISYHSKCYQSFTMKSTLAQMGSSLDKSLQFLSFERGICQKSVQSNAQQGTVLLLKECIF